MCCKHTSNSDARSALHMSSATKKTANEESATSGVKGVLCMMAEFFVGLQKFFSSLFFVMFFFLGSSSLFFKNERPQYV